MKKLLSIVLILIISGCASKNYNVKMKVVKYKQWNNIKYDWYDSIEINGNYCKYIKNTITPETNYIHGEFQLINYSQYKKEN